MSLFPAIPVLSVSALHSVFAAPFIELSAKASLIDDEVAIKISQLHPHAMIEVQAETIDDLGIRWTAQACFQANERGEIDLSRIAPLQGSYHGIDPMGLFWSMQPDSPGASFKITQESYIVRLKVIHGQAIASTEIVRLRKAPDVRTIPVQEKGVVGILFLPPSDKPLPVIITLSGSNGGLSPNRAQLLSSHGFAVLALGYFGVEGLPSNLQDIPLEYFENAFQWLKSQPAVDGSRVGIYGVSRGGELALILGSYFSSSVQSIVAVVPSSVVYGGLSQTPVNAWTYQGKSIAPSAPVLETDVTDGLDPSRPATTRPNFLEGMKNKAVYDAAVIPVENIACPTLLISGGDDQMWPSELYAQQIQERLKSKQSKIVCEHLHYPKAGHGINIPNLPQPGPVYYHPLAKRWFSMGGTVQEDQYASQDSWKKLIAFFDKSLKSASLDK